MKIKRTEAQEPYYIGLNAGPAYAAYAVTNTSYNLSKFNGKDMWGVYKFDEAETAEERTQYRQGRVNKKKIKERIGLLRSYFADEVQKVDENFFVRLDNSFYYSEDKDIRLNGDRNVLFADKDYCDRQYMSEYPTIYHLRSELAHGSQKPDIRCLYLAVSHMMKNRGNFYTRNLENTDTLLGEVYQSICTKAAEHDIVLKMEVPAEKIMDIMTNTGISGKVKATLVTQLIDATTKPAVSIIKLMCGLKAKIADIFPEVAENLEEDEKKLSFSFKDEDYFEKAEDIEKLIGENEYSLIESVKEMYDAAIIKNIIQDYRYVSDAKIASYDKHANDLKVLKAELKIILPEDEYRRFFSKEEPGTYGAYVHFSNHNIHDGITRRKSDKGRTQEELYHTIKKYLADADDEQAEYILDEIDKGTFLPKQRIKDNSLIPNQLYSVELKAILDNASKYYDFLNSRDESGLTVSERILSLFTFTMPYFIGPVSPYNSRGWAVRKEPGKVYPWNLKDKVDMGESAKQFIEKVIGKCNYLTGEKVLPNASLLYEKYRVLNELNNICIDGEKISIEMKQAIVNELLYSGKTISKKKIQSFLVKKGSATSDSIITGIDEKLNNSMASHRFFTDIFGSLNKDNEAVAEDIIFWSTIYGASKEFIIEQVLNKYPDMFDEEQLRKIHNLNCKDWGRLSREFLNMKGLDKENDEYISVIDAMWNNNLNLMELMYDTRFDFSSRVKDKTKNAAKNLFSFDYDDLYDLYATTAQRRTIWASVKIVREIVRLKGYAPESIFLETVKSRPNDILKESRKGKLTALYKGLKGVSADWKKQMASLIDECDADGSLKAKNVYLYFLQMGKDMYTGEDISLEELKSPDKGKKHNIDHIYPKHFVKDESIDNLVLTNTDLNRDLSDTYPVPQDIYDSMHEFWQQLRRSGLISAEKLARLSDRNPLSDEKRASFIGKLYNQAGSSTRMLANVFKNILPKDTKIIYAKTSETNDFRRKFDFPRATIINDDYLAKDAYLNIVVGNVWYTKFTASPIWYIKEEYRKKKSEYNLNRMYDFNIIRDDRIAWITDKTNPEAATINTVNKVMNRNTVITITRTTQGHGGLTHATITRADKSKEGVYLPLKTSDERMSVTKYGGKTSITSAYMFLAEHTLKKSRVRTIYSLPLHLVSQIKGKKDLEKYCTDVLHLINPVVKIAKILLFSELIIDGYNYLLGGRTGPQYFLRNNVPMRVSAEWQKYVSKIEKYINFKSLDKDISAEKNIELYDELVDKHSNSIYAKRRNAAADMLKKGRETFIKLSVKEQLEVLNQIFILTRMGTNITNLSGIGAGQHVGSITMGCNISAFNSVKLVNRSVTGLICNEVDLLHV